MIIRKFIWIHKSLYDTNWHSQQVPVTFGWKMSSIHCSRMRLISEIFSISHKVPREHNDSIHFHTFIQQQDGRDITQSDCPENNTGHNGVIYAIVIAYKEPCCTLEVWKALTTNFQLTGSTDCCHASEKVHMCNEGIKAVQKEDRFRAVVYLF